MESEDIVCGVSTPMTRDILEISDYLRRDCTSFNLGSLDDELKKIVVDISENGDQCEPSTNRIADFISKLDLAFADMRCSAIEFTAALLEFLRINGISLPNSVNVNQDLTIIKSGSSLHSLANDAELEVQMLWNSFCARITDAINGELGMFTLEQTLSDTVQQLCGRGLDLLATFHSSSETWSYYRHLRQEQLFAFFKKLRTEEQPETVSDKLSLLSEVESALPLLTGNLEFDLRLGITFVSPRAVARDIYVAPVSEFAAELLPILIPPKTSTNTTARADDVPQRVGVAARRSRLQQLRKTVTRRSSSLDSLLASNSQAPATGKAAANDEALTPLLRFASVLHAFQRRTDAAIGCWDTAYSHITASAHRRSRSFDGLPRGVLKRSLSWTAVPSHDSEQIFDWLTLFRRFLPSVLLALNELVADRIQVAVMDVSQASETGTKLAAGEDGVCESIRRAGHGLDCAGPLMAMLSRSLHTVSQFTDLLLLASRNLHMSLTKLISDVERNLSHADNLHIILASTLFFHQRLRSLDRLIGGCAVAGRSFSELSVSASSCIIEYHVGRITGVVLHDGESNNWQEDKEFSDTGRCGRHIEQWIRYLSRLLRIWRKLTLFSSVETDVFGQILLQTFRVLVDRYTNLQPSFRRLNQFRLDVVTMLEFTAQLLPCISTTPDQILSASVCGSNDLPLQLHQLCSTLFSTMVLTTVPIAKLARFYRKGATRRQTAGYCEFWIRWLRPLLLPWEFGAGDLSSLSTSWAIGVRLWFLVSKPAPDFPQMLELLLSRDCTLSILLLAHEELRDSVHLNQGILCALARCSEWLASALALTLEPVISRSESWYVMRVGWHAENPPAWLLALCHILRRFCELLLGPSLRRLAHHYSPEHDGTCLGGLSTLPCGCQPKFPPKRQSDDEVLCECLSSIVEDFCQLASLVPPAICSLTALRGVAKEAGVRPAYDSIPFHLVVTALCFWLRQSDFLTCFVPLHPDHPAVGLLVPNLNHLMTSSKTKGVDTPRFARQLLRADKSLTQKRLTTAVEAMERAAEFTQQQPPPSSVSDPPDSHLLSLLTEIYEGIASNPTEAASLSSVHDFLTSNRSWIGEQLGIAEALRSPVGLLPDFNTVAQQVASLGSEMDCSALLSRDLGVSQHALCRLLANRPEFAPEAQLTDSEKRSVATLRSKFFDKSG